MPNPGEEEESGMPPMMPGDEGSGKGTNSFYIVKTIARAVAHTHGSSSEKMLVHSFS